MASSVQASPYHQALQEHCETLMAAPISPPVSTHYLIIQAPKIPSCILMQAAIIPPHNARSGSGLVAQLVRAPACHAGGRGFKSLPGRQ